MCHACLLGYRKYVHELPDPTSLVIKTDDLINGRYEWDPEYIQGWESGGGIIFSKEEREEYELNRRMSKLIDEKFPSKLPFNIIL